ncbi:MAG: hypothetical protein A2751_01850 [Candidatus Doudnabacteria bacterium RIFCSPHIGHO2_01_FULL_46_14]|uniref:Cytoskeleton protein RodZ-like C-terminal domain-containing protein n=1 Tax=Candidatus Doudnabacteria bacterium RIFCSPHIGHO2_01_FULL_46_14 TaxID=1817824 RepID=A0A1F5NJH3_9BACT|nr:MAG: hypothetical protein A2751_01850 [Candidatus Doudnabacteria bacterium RIFCSPHIGHO2_01_FULL_46_14]
MAFKTKPVKIQTLSEQLVALRNHLGVSVQEISKVSKIPPKYLEALEQGDYASLPSPVYVKGFLKMLSRIYRASEANLAALYDAEKILNDNIKTKPEKLRNPLSSFVFSPRTVALGGLAIAGIASLSYLYFQISSVKKPPRLEVFSPQQSGPLETSLITVAGKTEAGAAVFLNNQPVVVDVSGEFRENLSLAPGTNQLVIKAVSKFEKETVITRSVVIVEKQIAGVFDGQSASTTPEMMSGVELEIKIGPEASWVSIMADGRDEFTGTMLAGSARTARGNNIKVNTSNAGSTRVILGGRDLGIMGKEGESLKDVVFTK